MAQFSFNATQYTPEYGGRGGLPPGQKYKGVIVASSLENNAKGNGGFLELTIAVIEGPLKDQTMTDRLNLNHPTATVVAIANKQLAAYCAVMNTPMINDTNELHNKPFMFDVGWQKGQEPNEEKPQGGFTEVKALYDMNGNKPQDVGKGPQHVNNTPPPPANNTPPANVAATGGGWGGNNGNNNAPPPANNTPPANNGAGGGWGQQGGGAAPGWGQR